MHKIFKVRYEEDGVLIAILYFVDKLYNILETGSGVKLVQMILQSSIELDYMSRSQVTVLGSFRVTCLTLQAYTSVAVGVNSV